MQWHDESIVLSARKHGEGALIVSLLTSAHGRHAGLVRGSVRNFGSLLQAGNELAVTWRARLPEHLGSLQVEPLVTRAALLSDRARLLGLSAACAMAEALLPERQPHPRIFAALRIFLAVLEGEEQWPSLYVRWELGVLQELGFGLDLTACAATGSQEDLAYVSPRSGRAVSAGAGRPFHDRLFQLPNFLLGRQGESGASHGDIVAGLDLCGHFFRHHVLSREQSDLPAARQRLRAHFAAPS